MPMIDVEMVVRDESEDRLMPEDVRDLANNLAGFLGSGPGDLWLRLRYLPESRYAENGQSKSTYPVFVTILKAQIPGPETLADEMRGIAAAVGTNLDRPQEHVHVVYKPDALGRIGFEGELAGG